MKNLRASLDVQRQSTFHSPKTSNLNLRTFHVPNGTVFSCCSDFSGTLGQYRTVAGKGHVIINFFQTGNRDFKVENREFEVDNRESRFSTLKSLFATSKSRFPTLKSRFSTLKSRSPLSTRDRYFEVAILHFKLAILHFEVAIRCLKKVNNNMALTGHRNIARYTENFETLVLEISVPFDASPRISKICCSCSYCN